MLKSGIQMTREQLEADCKVMSVNDIALKYGVSGSTVRVALKKFGLKVQFDKRKSKEFRDKMSSIVKNRYDDDEYRSKISDATRNSWVNGKYEGTLDSIRSRCKDPDYIKLQSTIQKAKWQGLEYRAKMLALYKDIYSTPEFRAKMSDVVTKRWESDEYRTLQAYIHSLPEYRSKLRVASKNTWTDQKYADTIRRLIKAKWQDPIFKERMGLIFTSDEYSDKLSKSSKALWSSAEYRNKMLSLFRSDEYRNALYVAYNSDEYRQKRALLRSKMPHTLTKPHVKVCEILKSMDVETTIEHPIGPYNFDIFVPSHNLLIEVQGDYWHSLPKAVRNDKAKATYIQRYFPQYKLKYIWEHECLSMGSVECKIKNWLGINADRTILTTKDLNVLNVDRDSADTFLYNWHYQHHGRHGLDIGGYYNNELVYMSRWTGPSRAEIATSMGFKQSEVLELSRLCGHPLYKIDNCGSWLLARAEKIIKERMPHIRRLVTFADTSYNHTGAIYKASNWILMDTIPPDYFYKNVDGFIMHKKTLWNHANSLGMKESDFAEKYSYVKVYGFEKHKFIKDLS